MAKKQAPEVPVEQLELYDQLIALFPEVERKGIKSAYTSVNGHIFSHLRPDGVLALRLSKSDQKEFVEKYNTDSVTAHGSVMREYVAVPSEVLSDTQKTKTYFSKSYEYVSNLKPKPTKKEKIT